MEPKNISIQSPLRYPGSKRRMLQFLMQHLPEGKQIAGVYYEPFVGSASVYFSLSPKRAILSDINPDLIDLLIGMQKYPLEVWHLYCQYGDSKQEYERIRDIDHSSIIQERAARVLYLNRTCFKGMWRTNKKGEFNVGYGGQDRRWVINEKNLIEVSIAFRNAKILCADFEDVIYSAKPGDFIFVDPPYKPAEAQGKNDHYVGKTFRLEEQKRLAGVLKWATRNNIEWAMTNSSHSEILKNYLGYYMLEFPKGTGRLPGLLASNSGEALITNYPILGGRLL